MERRGGPRRIGRKHLLLGLCGLVIAGALLLRVRGALEEDRLALAAAPAEDRGLPALRAPRDYVLNPDVAPGEETRGSRRIVSLAPSVTETLCALGLGDRLVGRTQFCQYPRSVLDVPVVGGIMDTNLEMIRALEPDVVLTTANSGGVGLKLETLGLDHVSLPHDSLEEVFTAIEQAGRVCNRPRTAERLVAAIRADLEDLRAQARRIHTRPLRVLMVCGELPVPPAAVWAAGPGLFLDTLLRDSGHHNAAAEVLQSSFGEIPLERLVVLDPEVILTFPAAVPSESVMLRAYRSWSPLKGMQAIRSQRVRAVGGPEWLSAGPRVAVELHRLIAVLSEFRSKPPT